MKKEKIVISSVGVFVCAFLCVMFLGACNIQISPNPSEFNSDKNISSFENSNTNISDETEMENISGGNTEGSSERDSGNEQVSTSSSTVSKKPDVVTSNSNSSKKPSVTTSQKPKPSVSPNISSSNNSFTSSPTTSNDGWTGDYPIPSYPYQ